MPLLYALLHTFMPLFHRANALSHSFPCIRTLSVSHSPALLLPWFSIVLFGSICTLLHSSALVCIFRHFCAISRSPALFTLFTLFALFILFRTFYTLSHSSRAFHNFYTLSHYFILSRSFYTLFALFYTLLPYLPSSAFFHTLLHSLTVFQTL